MERIMNETLFELGVKNSNCIKKNETKKEKNAIIEDISKDLENSFSSGFSSFRNSEKNDSPEKTFKKVSSCSNSEKFSNSESSFGYFKIFFYNFNVKSSSFV